MWPGPQPGDILEVVSNWSGPHIYGVAHLDSPWLVLKAGEYVKVIEIATDGKLFVGLEDSEHEGWIGGPGCLLRATLEFAVGPQERVVHAHGTPPQAPSQKRIRADPGRAPPPPPGHNMASAASPPATGLTRPLVGRVVPAPPGAVPAPPGAVPAPPGAVPAPPEVGVPQEAEINGLIEQRNEARRCADYAAADSIRDSLKARGVSLFDERGAAGTGAMVTRWRYTADEGALPPPGAPAQPHGRLTPSLHPRGPPVSLRGLHPRGPRPPVPPPPGLHPRECET